MKYLYADTKEELSVKMVGMFHDRCYHYYWGKVADMPEKYKTDDFDDTQEYVLVYSE
jgi:hypothetical protein